MSPQLTNETHPQYQTSKSFGVIGMGFIAAITHQCAFHLVERIMSIKKEGKSGWLTCGRKAETEVLAASLICTIKCCENWGWADVVINKNPPLGGLVCGLSN
ncbi:hypothetical protein KW426_19095 [Vibrio fluvialis]|nr:hypothetical protein [Vibrio fluvialis]MBY7775226.1 hypothetical protein [Vibrio fluvialis]MBY7779574.1 hypothetical protein [Vibrio fluvialis]MBY7988836.1 hypothetical protein [Vibrio fluvialis]MBY7993157.1 hypothetical protein [Vibrio fluvialis]